MRRDYYVVLLSLGCITLIYLLQEKVRLIPPTLVLADLGRLPLAQQMCLLVNAYTFVRAHADYFEGGTCVRNWHELQAQWQQRVFPRFPIRECVSFFSITARRLPLVHSYETLLLLPPPMITSMLYVGGAYNHTAACASSSKYFMTMRP